MFKPIQMSDARPRAHRATPPPKSPEPVFAHQPLDEEARDQHFTLALKARLDRDGHLNSPGPVRTPSVGYLLWQQLHGKAPVALKDSRGQRLSPEAVLPGGRREQGPSFDYDRSSLALLSLASGGQRWQQVDHATFATPSERMAAAVAHAQAEGAEVLGLVYTPPQRPRDFLERVKQSAAGEWLAQTFFDGTPIFAMDGAPLPLEKIFTLDREVGLALYAHAETGARRWEVVSEGPVVESNGWGGTVEVNPERVQAKRRPDELVLGMAHNHPSLRNRYRPNGGELIDIVYSLPRPSNGDLSHDVKWDWRGVFGPWFAGVVISHEQVDGKWQGVVVNYGYAREVSLRVDASTVGPEAVSAEAAGWAVSLADAGSVFQVARDDAGALKGMAARLEHTPVPTAQVWVEPGPGSRRTHERLVEGALLELTLGAGERSAMVVGADGSATRSAHVESFEGPAGDGTADVCSADNGKLLWLRLEGVPPAASGARPLLMRLDPELGERLTNDGAWPVPIGPGVPVAERIPVYSVDLRHYDVREDADAIQALRTLLEVCAQSGPLRLVAVFESNNPRKGLRTLVHEAKSSGRVAGVTEPFGVLNQPHFYVDLLPE